MNHLRFFRVPMIFSAILLLATSCTPFIQSPETSENTIVTNLDRTKSVTTTTFPIRSLRRCDDIDCEREEELPEPTADPAPLGLTIQSTGLGPSRDIAASSTDSFVPTTAYFRSNEPFTLSASATDKDGVAQVVIVGTARVICYGQRIDAASPQPVSVTDYAIREENTAASRVADLSVTKTMKAADFPCSSHSLARVEFAVHAEGRNVDNQTVATHSLQLVYIATINVMTFNIHGGVGGIDIHLNNDHAVYDITNAAAVILQNDTDIALLQEVRRHWDGESNWEDQIELLGQKTGMYAAYTPGVFRYRPWSCLSIGFWTNPSCPYPERDSGVLILSKFPIISNTYVELKRMDRDTSSTDTLGFQDVVVDIGGTPVRVINIHNCLGETEMCPSWDDQWIVTTGVLAHVGTPDLPVLLGGDFNIGMELESDSTRPIMNSTFEHVCFLYNACVNWSAGKFNHDWFHWGAIDHLFIWDSGIPKFGVLDGYVPYTGTPFQTSDHYPLVARLMFSDNKVQPPPTVAPSPVVTPTGGGQCVQVCEDQLDTCMKDVSEGIGSGTGMECTRQYNQCRRICQ